MKFISGVYDPKLKEPEKSIQDCFRPYTVNDFIKELDQLCSFDYSKLVQHFANRGIDDLEFNNLMQFSDEDQYGTAVTKTYSMFRGITETGGTRVLNGDGWGQMVRTFFGNPSDKVKQIRRNLGYDIAGGITGKVKLNRGEPVHLYSNCYTNTKRMFKWFINDPNTIDWDPDFPEKHIIIQFFSWSWNKSKHTWDPMYKNQNVDTKFVVTQIELINAEQDEYYYHGFLDTEGASPYVLDMALNERMSIKYGLENTIYMLSPEHALALGILDKLRMMSTYKAIKLRATDLVNAIKVMTQNTEILEDCDPNLQIQLACRVRIIPYNYRIEDGEKVDANTGIPGDRMSAYYARSHFFNWFDEYYCSKSWSDVYGNASQFQTDDLEEVWQELKLKFTFLQETAMQEGIFCIDMDEYRKFLIKDSYVSEVFKAFQIRADIPQSNIMSHVVMRSGGIGSSLEEIISIGKLNPMNSTVIDCINICKKLNQRKKLIVSRKYMVTFKPYTEEEIQQRSWRGTIIKELTGMPEYPAYFGNSRIDVKGTRDNPFILDRYINGLDKYKNRMFKTDIFKANALVGFIEPTDYYPDLTHEQFQNMDEKELAKFCKASPGIASDAFFTKEFLHDIWIAPKRTERISCRREEMSEYMLEKLNHLDEYMNGKRDDCITYDFRPGKMRRKDPQMISHYTVSCPECDSRMVEGNKDGGLKKANNFVRPTSQYFFCPTCGHDMENPNTDPSNGKPMIVKTHYIATGKVDYQVMHILSYKEVENGINLKVEYNFPVSNARVTCGDGSKVGLRETKSTAVGKIKELRMKDPFDHSKELIYKDVQLDGIMYKPSTKGEQVQVMNAGIRMYNLIFGKKKALTGSKERIVSSYEKFEVDGEMIDLPFEPTNYCSINDYIEVDNPDFKLTELNQRLIQNLEKVEVEIEMYNPNTDSYELQTLKMYVGVLALNFTEVAQEFRKAYSFDNPHKLSQVNLDMFSLFGYDDLVEHLSYEENMRSFQRKSEDGHDRKIVSELLKILACLNNPVPFNKDSALTIDTEEELYFGLKDLMYENNVEKLTPLDFHQERENRVTMSNFIDYSEYVKIRKYHPMLNHPKFVNGNYGEFVFTKYTKKKKFGTIELNRKLMTYNIRFLPTEIFHSLVDHNFNGFKVRLDDVYTAYMELFELISTSAVAPDGSLRGISNGKPVGDYLIDKLKNAIYKYLLPKDGAFVVNSSVNLISVGSKLVTDPRIPWDVVILSDDEQYKRAVRDVLKRLDESDVEQDWEIKTDKDGNYTKLGWCWDIDLEGIVHRNPVGPMPYQNMPHQTWSRHRANKEFRHLYGTSFDEEFPGCRAIMTCSTRSVADREEDVDGDWIEVAFASSTKGQALLKELRENITNNQMFKSTEYYNELLKEETNPVKQHRIEVLKNMSENSSKARFDYMMDERRGAMVCYPEKLVYDLSLCKINKGYADLALFEARESKKDIGLLTNSFRKMMYTVEFLYEKKQKNPTVYKFKLDFKAKQGIIYIFQYVLLQRNAIRAVKQNGPYGKLTMDAIIRNAQISFRTNEGKQTEYARTLLEQALTDFDKEYETNLHNYYSVILDICDNFMISTEANFGGGYTYNEEGKVVKDRSGTYIDPSYRDLLGLFHVITGSSTDGFIRIFKENKLFKGIHSKVLLNIPMLKNIGKDFMKLLGNTTKDIAPSKEYEQKLDKALPRIVPITEKKSNDILKLTAKKD